MIVVVLLLAVTIAAGGSLLVGVYLGTLLERERAARHRPAPHEALAAEAIVLGLRGPLPGGRA